MNTREFGREQFCKVDSESQREVMFKMAAMSEIKDAMNSNVKSKLSIANQLICLDT